MWRKKSNDDMPIDFGIFEEMIEDLIEHIEEISDGGPEAYGFSITKRPGEVPEVIGFSSHPRVDEPALEGYKPLLEFFESDSCVQVAIELPGIERDAISLDATENTLTIIVRVDDRKYSETVELPARVDPSSASASYHNGVLDVTLTRTGDAKTRIEIV